ncbi:hypothetical protein PF008_g17496 [Phytophthora fragariae]|uniref:Uncharacterized protein n=1 Tax=Phytophthora fragariae TaxID=53985 RepID=A0A6G0R824_9STRA|nr:hypothetical protein PF008_g17496 [Phytophthora fragariae]
MLALQASDKQASLNLFGIGSQLQQLVQAKSATDAAAEGCELNTGGQLTQIMTCNPTSLEDAVVKQFRQLGEALDVPEVGEFMAQQYWDKPSNLHAADAGTQTEADESQKLAENGAGVHLGAFGEVANMVAWKRLLDKFNVGIRQGKQAADFTKLERLLDQYTQAEAQYKQQKADPGHRTQPLQDTPCHAAPNFSDSQSDDDDSGAAEPAQHRTLPLPVESVSTPAPSASVQSPPERGRKPRKRRFFFQDWHDRLLLNAMLADQGVLMASGARKPSWKSITASLTSHGLDVNTHTLRTHLQLIVDTYRKEASSWDTYPGQLPEKQKLLRDYCRKLDNQETQDHGDQSVEPGIEDQDSHFHDDRAATNRLEIGGRVVESARPSQNHATDLVPAVAVVEISQDQDFIVTSTQTSEAASSPIPIAQTPSTTATSSSLDTQGESVQTAEGFSTPIASRDCSATQPQPDDETGEGTEPAWKRQKLELETILQRFVSEQSERQREEREQERIRFSEQQDLQRQTIQLQKRALDMQEKAMSMQDRLMTLAIFKDEFRSSHWGWSVWNSSSFIHSCC